jgi:hypothetical protein
MLRLVQLSVLSAWLVGCGSGITLHLSAAEIQQSLQKRLPFTKEYRLATIIIKDAVVKLSEGSDRVGVQAMATFRLPLVGEVDGDAMLDGEINYVPSSGEFYLVHPQVREINIPKLPAVARPKVEELIAKGAEFYLSVVPVYRLKPENTKQSLAKLFLKSVKVQNGQLVLVLGI